MVWFWPCPKTLDQVLELREKGYCFASAIGNDSGGSTKGFSKCPTPERRPKKVWFLFGGTENKAFLCSRFRKRGAQVQRGISALAAIAAGTGPRILTSRSVSGAVRVAVFFQVQPWKKKVKKVSKKFGLQK